MITCLVSELIALGFTPRVAEAYVFLAQRGNAAARDVAEELAISRSSAHEVVKQLVAYGFVREERHGRFARFITEPPSVVRAALDAKRKRADECLARFDTVLPSLRALHGVGGDAPVMRYVDGDDGLREIQKEFEALPGEIVQIFDYDAFCRSGGERLAQEHRTTLQQQQRRVRSLLIAQCMPKNVDDGTYALRGIPPDLFTASGEMSICDDRVLLLSYAPTMGAVLIRSNVIADICRVSFELGWRMAGEMERWEKNVVLSFPERVAS